MGAHFQDDHRSHVDPLHAAMCRDFLDDWYRPNLAAENLLDAAANHAGGHVTLLRPKAKEWHRVLTATGGNVYGVTMPFPRGWLSIIPDLGVGTHTTVGHEAAHILFGDVPHWDAVGAKRQTQLTQALASLLHHRIPDELLTETGVMLRSCHGRQEARAEFMGIILESRLRSGSNPRTRIDSLFGAPELW